MAKENNDQRVPQTEDVLDQLAFLANEDLQLRDSSFLKQNRKRKKSSESKRAAKDREQGEKVKKIAENENIGSEESSEAADMTAQTDGKRNKRSSITGIQDTVKTKEPPIDPNKEEDMFSILSAQMGEAAKSLSRKTPAPSEETPDVSKEEHQGTGEPAEIPAEKKKKRRRKKKSPSKELKESVHLIGEEITKEKAEEIIAGSGPAEKRGHRTTIIIHRMIVDKEGEPVAEPADSPEKAEQTPAKKTPVKEEKPPEPERKRLLLVRVDTGEAYPVDQDLTIGREDDNDIVIPEPEGHYVSGYHATVTVQGKDIFLKDSGSTNGTFINGGKIGSKRLKAGQRIKFADIEFAVEEE